MNSNRCPLTLYSYRASQITKQALKLSQHLKVWTIESNTNVFVLTVDNVIVFLPLFRAVEPILTIFQGRTMQEIKDPLWTLGDLVQFTPCLSIQGGIVSIITRIRLLKVRIPMWKFKNDYYDEKLFGKIHS